MRNLRIGDKVQIKKGESCYFIRPQDDWYQDAFTVANIETSSKEGDAIQLEELLVGPLHDRLEQAFEEDPKYHLFGSYKFKLIE